MSVPLRVFLLRRSRTVRTLNFVYDETLLKCASGSIVDLLGGYIVVRLWPAEVMHI